MTVHDLWWMRLSTRRLISTGIVLMLFGVTPLLLYTLFGTAGSLPLWPGVMAVVAVPIGFLVFGVGLLKLLLVRLQDRH